MANTKERRHFTGQEKVAILRRHLIEGVPVSALCEEHRFPPTALYRWQKELFEQGATVFDAPRGRNGSAKGQQDAAAKRIAALEEKLRRKDEVLSELLEEHVALKKSLGAT